MPRRGPTPETRLKRSCKQFMSIHCIFNFPITQGLGCYRGAPDIVAHHRGRVVYLEIKTPTGRLSNYQEQFKVQCERDGIEYHVVRDVYDLIDIFNIPTIVR